MCTIEFFNNEKSQGCFDLIERSDELHRRMVAIDHDIKKWTHYVIDNGRLFGVRLSKNYVLMAEGAPRVFKLSKITKGI